MASLAISSITIHPDIFILERANVKLMTFAFGECNPSSINKSISFGIFLEIFSYVIGLV